MTSQGEYNRTNMLKAIREHANGHIAKHAMNVEIYLQRAAGVGEHPDILDAIEKDPNTNWTGYQSIFKSELYKK